MQERCLNAKANPFGGRGKRESFALGLLCAAVIPMLYAGMLSFWTMSAAEGWYTYYAQLINDGEMVYRDFAYLFFPFYIQLIALFTKIFGYAILPLRVFGIALFAGIGITAYLIFYQLKPSALGAMLASVATTIYLQSEAVQIFYDYIRVMDLAAYLYILLLVLFLKSLQKESHGINSYVILMAVFGAIACMTKQSTGTLILVYTIVLLFFLLLVLDRTKTKYLLINAGVFMAAVLFLFAVMFVWLAVNGALPSFLAETTGSAVEAKGGLATVLFRWIISESQGMLRALIPGGGYIAFCLACAGFVTSRAISAKT